jgi:hypothetical protein
VVGIALAQGAEGVGADEPGAGLAHRAERVCARLDRHVDQVGDQLGVRLGADRATGPLQLLAQLPVVLDDAVVDDGDRAGSVRMRVALGRLAVGRPARVANADVAAERPVAQDLLEVAQLAHGPAHLDGRAAYDGDPGGVVAPVLQPLQAVEQHVHRVRFVPDESDDSTHGPLP